MNKPMPAPTLTQPSTVLVTGASGALGPQVVAALAAAGYAVRVLVRQSPSPGRLPGGVDVQLGDITDASAVAAAMAGCQAVVHMAALLHIVDPAPALRAEYERINVGGTANIVAAALSAGVARLIFFSTIAVYGDSGGQILDENTRPQPTTLYGQSKLAAEQIVAQARCADGQPLGVILRLSAVYGAGVKGNYERLLHALARDRFLPLGRGQNRLGADRLVERPASGNGGGAPDCGQQSGFFGPQLGAGQDFYGRCRQRLSGFQLCRFATHCGTTTSPAGLGRSAAGLALCL